MQEQQDLPERTTWKEEVRTGLVLAAIALLIDVSYASWRAIAETGVSIGSRLTEFADALVWPGLAIFLIAFVVMWLGWKLELD